jgi:chromosome segregation ATPase
MILAEIAPTWQLVTAVGVVAGVIITLWKLRPERDSIIADAAEKAVDAMSGAFAEVRQQLEIAQAHLAQVSRELEHERGEREREREEQREVRHELKRRVAELELQTNLKPVMAALIKIQDGQREIADVLHQLVDRIAA